MKKHLDDIIDPITFLSIGYDTQERWITIRIYKNCYNLDFKSKFPYFKSWKRRSLGEKVKRTNN